MTHGSLNAIESSQVQLPPDWTVLEGIENARDLFIGYILLDALIGNGDRHHENWGFVLSSSPVKVKLRNAEIHTR